MYLPFQSMSVPRSTTGLPEGATISVAAQPKDCQGNTYTKKVKVAFYLPMTKADFTSAKQTLLSKNFLADTLNVARCKVSIGVIIDATAWNLKKGIVVAMYVTAKDQAEADGMVQAMAVTAKNQTEADRMVQAIATAKDQAEADMIAQALALWTDAGLTSRFIKIGLIGPKDVAAMAAQPTVNDAPLVTSETNGPTNLPSGAAVTPQVQAHASWHSNGNMNVRRRLMLYFRSWLYNLTYKRIHTSPVYFTHRLVNSRGYSSGALTTTSAVKRPRNCVLEPSWARR
jgi:hypothetical protein